MNQFEQLLKDAESYSIEELKMLSQTARTMFTDKMEQHRKSLDVMKLPFPEFHEAYADIWGTTMYGKKFENWMRRQYGWTCPKADKTDPGDAETPFGERLEVKYGGVSYSSSRLGNITWNRVQFRNKSEHYLLYAHDWTVDGKVFSFYLTKEQALSMRDNNENSQITSNFTFRKGTKWPRMQEFLIGVSDRPIVPEFLTTTKKGGIVAA